MVPSRLLECRLKAAVAAPVGDTHLAKFHTDVHRAVVQPLLEEVMFVLMPLHGQVKEEHAICIDSSVLWEWRDYAPFL